MLAGDTCSIGGPVSIRLLMNTPLPECGAEEQKYITRTAEAGAGGGSRTHTGRETLRIFIPAAAFAALTEAPSALRSGLRSGLSLHLLPDAPGLRCCPSSLYTFPAEISVQAWLGIAIAGFPEFGQFCIAGFPASTQVSLSPLRMPFRHARVAVSSCLS